MNSYNNFAAASKGALVKFEGFEANGSQLIVKMLSKFIACLEIARKKLEIQLLVVFHCAEIHRKASAGFHSQLLN